MSTLDLEKIALMINAELVGNPRHVIVGVADIEQAKSDQISFAANPRYISKIEKSQAGAIIVKADAPKIEGRNYLIHDDPSEAFQKIIDFLFKDKRKKSAFEGIHPTAVIHPTAKIGKNVTLGPYCVVDADTVIGDNTYIGAHCSIGWDVKIGSDCQFQPHVTVAEDCEIGDRVVLHSGVILGMSGFGYTQKQGKFTRLEHFGKIILENDVEIGSSTNVQKARFDKTVVGEGTKIDALCEIAHNVQIGKHCIIIGQSVIAGSTKIGNFVMISAKVAIDGHLEIADFVMVRAYSGITKSILKPGAYGGIPAREIKEENRNTAQLRRFSKTLQRIDSLEEKVSQLQS